MNEFVLPIEIIGRLNYTYYDINLFWFNHSKQKTFTINFKLIEEDIIRYGIDLYIENIHHNMLIYGLENDIVIPFTYTQIKNIVNKILNKTGDCFEFKFEEIIKLKL